MFIIIIIVVDTKVEKSWTKYSVSLKTKIQLSKVVDKVQGRNTVY